ncbi:hypothetical protein DRW07_15410 [Alteromonas sediminis]|uniref:Uncharacterized protein n=1 Tax=Alteromonas sediminis TaxID=2259342 RepID=A0A3N5XXU1_9ALTE|nr:hypothetical protein [Alteromonas sediminis]RPJ65293.1 hypothetical protein DRW07_15410 [Alteromonas sediminis]
MSKHDRKTSETENASIALNKEQFDKYNEASKGTITQRIDELALQEGNRRLTSYFGLENQWYKTLGYRSKSSFIASFPLSRQEVYKERNRALIELVIYKGNFEKIGTVRASHLDLLDSHGKQYYKQPEDRYAFFEGVWSLLTSSSEYDPKTVIANCILAHIKKYVCEDANIETKVSEETLSKLINNDGDQDPISRDKTALNDSNPTERARGTKKEQEVKPKPELKPQNLTQTKTKSTSNKATRIQEAYLDEESVEFERKLTNRDKVTMVRKWISELLEEGISLFLLLPNDQEKQSRKKIKSQLKDSLKKCRVEGKKTAV